MAEGSSIINLGDISKPATVLIEKISDAIGGSFKPFQIRRVAQAEADAEIIRAQAQIEVTDLQRRALIRFISEEEKKQDNMERITVKAIPQIKDSATPQDVENDWIANFFDKCRIVSDEEMQLLWARVLAVEANSPGTYSKRTVNLLGSIDKTDALLFTSLCGFGWNIEFEIVPMVFDTTDDIYTQQGINFSALTHLDDIGLITFGHVTGFRKTKISAKQLAVFYFEKPVLLEFKNQDQNELSVGNVLLTKAGQQLSKICGAKPVEGFLDYVIEELAKKGIVASFPSNKD